MRSHWAGRWLWKEGKKGWGERRGGGLYNSGGRSNSHSARVAEIGRLSGNGKVVAIIGMQARSPMACLLTRSIPFAAFDSSQD